jgi:hypothetical protein
LAGAPVSGNRSERLFTWNSHLPSPLPQLANDILTMRKPLPANGYGFCRQK